MKDVVVTVVVAIVLALAFMYLLLTIAFSGWGDHLPSPSAIESNLRTAQVVDAAGDRSAR